MYIIGDLNVNLLNHPNPLDDNPTLLDVILTNTPRRLTSVLNMSLGISDFHNCICVAKKCVNLTRQEGRLLIDHINIFMK